MKIMKGIITLLAVVILSFQMSAQVDVQAGAGFAFGSESDFGIQFNSHLEFNEQWEGSPSVTIFFGDFSNFFAIDLDAHYIFSEENDLTLYGLGGLNIATFKTEEVTIPFVGTVGGESFTEIGLNVGGGAEYVFADQISGVGEIKYVLSDFDQLVISATALYRFNK